MCNNNVPDDWDNFWIKCDKCGHRWHLSEGQSCEKCECIRKEWLQNHCVLCEEEFDEEQEVYPWDEEEEDACICWSCAYDQGMFDDDPSEDNDNDESDICYFCLQEAITFCPMCQRPVCSDHAHLSKAARGYICTNCATGRV